MGPSPPFISLQSAGGEKFRSQCRILGVEAAPDGRARHRRDFAHTAHFHTQMMRFKIYSHTVGMKHGFQSISELLTDPFLHRKALGEDLSF